MGTVKVRELIRELIKQYLNENSFIVSTAENASDANQKLSHFQFDLTPLSFNN